ncbi:MAG TPA: helix-turn-helix domain-containing protein [Candidatus Hydrogenedentes bacterium]|nr:helix-turn-helix domain-containing protein [Candidatus Hydrogenedentota bacterium]
MPYAHLSPYERGEIYILSMRGESLTEIGRKMGRHRATIGRELKRNGD